MPAHRMILGMVNHSLVPSEPIYDPAPFPTSKHYVEAEVREMPEVLRYCRAHTAERAEIVDRAYRFVTREFRTEALVLQIPSLVDALRCRRKVGS